MDKEEKEKEDREEEEDVERGGEARWLKGRTRRRRVGG